MPRPASRTSVGDGVEARRDVRTRIGQRVEDEPDDDGLLRQPGERQQQREQRQRRDRVDAVETPSTGGSSRRKRRAQQRQRERDDEPEQHRRDHGELQVLGAVAADELGLAGRATYSPQIQSLSQQAVVRDERVRRDHSAGVARHAPDATDPPMIRLEASASATPTARWRWTTLDLDVHRGEIVVLVGPSGCGKTTTLRMINRLIEPTAGRILLDGEDVTARRPGRSCGAASATSSSRSGCSRTRRSRRTSRPCRKLLGWDQRRKARERVDELLDLVGLEPGDVRDRYPHQLSGGQRSGSASRARWPPTRRCC